MKPTQPYLSDDYRPSELENSESNSKKSIENFRMELGWIRPKDDAQELDYEKLLED